MLASTVRSLELTELFAEFKHFCGFLLEGRGDACFDGPSIGCHGATARHGYLLSDQIFPLNKQTIHSPCRACPSESRAGRTARV